MALTKIDDRGLTTPIDLLDNEKIRFGTGNDLEIYHDGTHSIVNDAGTGQLRLTGSHVVLRAAPYGEVYQVCTENGAVELYFDNSKKLETITSGVRVSSGDLELLDNTGSTGRLLLGNGADLQLYHDGSHSYIKDAGTGDLRILSSELNIQNAAGTETQAYFAEDGAVGLYYDGTKTFETVQYGAKAGGQLNIYHQSGNSYIKNDSGNLHIGTDGGTYIYGGNDFGEYCATFLNDAATSLYFDHSKKFETTSYGNSVHGHLDIATDGDKLRMGGSYDLEIWHSGNHAYINNDTGNVAVESVANVNLKVATNEFGVNAIANGEVELYYDGVKAFKTGSNGNYFYKHCDPYVADSFNLGHNYRWKTLYTNNAVDVSSDRNTKNTIIDSDLGLSFINQLRPVSFKKNNQGDSIHYGLIAQEVEDVIKNTGKSLEEFSAISKPTDKTMGLAYSEFISPLIKAVQELSAEVEALKAK